MKRTQIIAKILYSITLLLALLYTVTTIYSLVCGISQTNISYLNNQVIVEYPFTDTSFLVLENHWTYWIFSFLLPLLFYVLFFWLFSRVFKVFFQKKLFTKLNIKHLKRFYQANIFLPVFLTILASFFVEIEKGIFLIIALHLFLGVLVLIISDIFQQGLHLQNEQDLYI